MTGVQTCALPISDGADRRAENFRVVAFPTARGCAAAYFPETNVLVPLDSTARGSNTPTSKSLVVSLEARPPEAPAAPWERVVARG